jgi:Tol biopolymer transport system component
MRRFIRVTAGLWLLIVILLVAVLVVGHVVGRDRGIIAFQSGRVGDTDIYLYDVQTRISHNLTHQPGRPQLWAHFLADSNVTSNDTPASDHVLPVWSPDGRYVAFIAWSNGVAWSSSDAEIYVIDLITGQLRNMTNDPGSYTLPVWSPDGTQLAFVSRRSHPHTIISVIDIESGNIRELTNRSYTSTFPSWSPDSRHIVFQARPGRYWDLYMIDLETGETRKLTNSTSDDLNPMWSAARP